MRTVLVSGVMPSHRASPASSNVQPPTRDTDQPHFHAEMQSPSNVDARNERGKQAVHVGQGDLIHGDTINVYPQKSSDVTGTAPNRQD
jgi:hypothetical protein